MTRIDRVRLAGAVAALGVSAAVLGSARCLSATQPSCSVATLFGGGPRLDVPYAETRQAAVAAMLDLAGVAPGDRVLDLGTGDGRIMIAAAERGAVGLGIDIDPILVRRARNSAAARGVGGRARFETRDLFATPLAGYDVMTMFLLPEVNLRLRPRLLAEATPGTRIVSHAFTMGDWRPDGVARVGGDRLYLWIAPASVAGRWRTDDGRVLTLRQRYQDVAGDLDGRPLAGLSLRGDTMRLTLAGRTATVRVTDSRLIGDGWSARRLATRERDAQPIG